jgi:DNA invertase Pin-like site-specific DNA recombinase
LPTVGDDGIAAVAQFELDLLIERSLSGKAHARAEERSSAGPTALTAEGREKALQRLTYGASISAVAREMVASRATLMRVGRAGSTALSAVATVASNESETRMVASEDQRRVPDNSAS